MRVSVKRARRVLLDLGLGPKLDNDRSAYVLMACCSLRGSSQWGDAAQASLGIAGMIEAINSGFPSANKGRGYKPNTRETIRDDTVKAFVSSGLLELEDPSIPANSQNIRYSSSRHLVALLQSVGTKRYETELLRMKAVGEESRKACSSRRKLEQTPVVVPGGAVEFISNDGQGPLIKAILESMLPRFAGGAKVLAIDTSDGLRFCKENGEVERLLFSQEKTAGNTPVYPDVVALDERRRRLFLIEACNSEGVFDEERCAKLRNLLRPVREKPIFITCFDSRKAMLRWFPDLAWETEVWLREDPEHMIHLDGDKYLSSYVEDDPTNGETR